MLLLCWLDFFAIYAPFMCRRIVRWAAFQRIRLIAIDQTCFCFERTRRYHRAMYLFLLFQQRTKAWIIVKLQGEFTFHIHRGILHVYPRCGFHVASLYIYEMQKCTKYKVRKGVVRLPQACPLLLWPYPWSLDGNISENDGPYSWAPNDGSIETSRLHPIVKN